MMDAQLAATTLLSRKSKPFSTVTAERSDAKVVKHAGNGLLLSRKDDHSYSFL